MMMVVSAAHIALQPDFYKFYDDGEFQRIDRLSKKVFCLVLVAALGLILFGKEVVMLLADEKFHEGLKVVPLVVIGYVFFGLFEMYGRYIGHEKKTYYSSIAIITAAGVNIVMSAAATPVNTVPSAKSTDSRSPGCSVTGTVKLIVYVVSAPAQAVAGLSKTVAPQVAPAVGTAIALRLSIKPSAITILSIFLTSFLLSCYQVLPDFEAVRFGFCGCPNSSVLGCPVW